MRNQKNDDHDPVLTLKRRRFWIAALGLWLLAATTRFWIAPHFELLPTNYAVETTYQAQSRARETPDGPWVNTPLVARRVDQALVASGDVAIVQGNMHWATASGQVLYETSGIYGVERRTLGNVKGYGNLDRSGQFLFPPHLQPASYRIWDPLYIGPRTATFKRRDVVEGVAVYVFVFTVRGLDETAGFSHLVDVPERFEAHTDADGTLWVEPISGVVVDYEDSGASYFFDAATKKRVVDLFVWSDHFTPQTKAAQLRLARATRFRCHALEFLLPLGLLLGGALCLARASRRQGTHPMAPGADLAVTGETL